MKLLRALWPLYLAGNLFAAERSFDFSESPTGTVPPGWKPFVAGVAGQPADWQIVQDDVTSAFAPLTPNAAKTSRKGVLAQLSRVSTDERFPILAFEDERFGDFNARLRFKLVAGEVEQMAGLAFRITDPKNFYVVRASRLGRNVRFYKFVNGTRSQPIGPEISLELNHWHELGVRTEANRIRVSLDGKEIMPELTDNSHQAGRIGLFTKSDAVSYFSELRLSYQPLETLAAGLVKTLLEKQPRLLDVQVLGKTPKQPALHVMGAKDPKNLDRLASETEAKVWADDVPYASRGPGPGVVTHPLHDRNGDVIGVARFVMRAFPGQLEDALVSKVGPWVRDMETRIGASKDLTE